MSQAKTMRCVINTLAAFRWATSALKANNAMFMLDKMGVRCRTVRDWWLKHTVQCFSRAKISLSFLKWLHSKVVECAYNDFARPAYISVSAFGYCSNWIISTYRFYIGRIRSNWWRPKLEKLILIATNTSIDFLCGQSSYGLLYAICFDFALKIERTIFNSFMRTLGLSGVNTRSQRNSQSPSQVYPRLKDRTFYWLLIQRLEVRIVLRNLNWLGRKCGSSYFHRRNYLDMKKHHVIRIYTI